MRWVPSEGLEGWAPPVSGGALLSEGTGQLAGGAGARAGPEVMGLQPGSWRRVGPETGSLTMAGRSGQFQPE